MSSFRWLLTGLCCLLIIMGRTESFAPKKNASSSSHSGTSCLLATVATTSSSSSSSSKEEEEDAISTQRRSLLLGTFLVTATSPELYYYYYSSFSKTQPQQQQQSQPSANFVPLNTLEQAIQVLETSVDPRFWHAVVASNYQCLYQTISEQQQQQLGIMTTATTTTTLDNDDDHDDNDDDDDMLWRYLEQHQLRDRPFLKPRQSQLAVVGSPFQKNTNPNLVSIWPLLRTNNSNDNDNHKVHYAWPETSLQFEKDSSVIVDGIDCGRMSLDDALLQQKQQVLVQADQFLVVPSSLQQSLMQSLKDSYFIM